MQTLINAALCGISFGTSLFAKVSVYGYPVYKEPLKFVLLSSEFCSHLDES